MFFVEWWIVGRVFVFLLAIIAGVFGFWGVRKKSSHVRVTVRFLSVAAVLFGASTLLFSWWAIASSHIFSDPVYSPNRQMAARIDDYDAGLLGGAYDAVELFGARGFRSEVVFTGDPESIEATSLRWKSDSELEITHRGTADLCLSTVYVRVSCVTK